MISSSASATAWTSCVHSDTDPQPTRTWPTSTPYFAASAAVSSIAPGTVRPGTYAGMPDSIGRSRTVMRSTFPRRCLQIAAAFLLALDGLEQRLEVALAEAQAAVPLDQ